MSLSGKWLGVGAALFGVAALALLLVPVGKGGSRVFPVEELLPGSGNTGGLVSREFYDAIREAEQRALIGLASLAVAAAMAVARRVQVRYVAAGGQDA